MATAKNDAAKALPPKDILIKDYELKVGYLTQHISRMWTPFNYFVGIESVLFGGSSFLAAVSFLRRWRLSARSRQ